MYNVQHFLYTMIIFFREFNLLFHRELQVFFQILNVTKNVYFCLMWSCVTKNVSKAGKGDPVEKVTLPVKFACKPVLSLTRLLG